MFLKNKIIIFFIIIFNLCLLLGCDPARQQTIKDIYLENESQYSLLAVVDPSAMLESEWIFTYGFILPGQTGILHVVPTSYKGFRFNRGDARKYYSLHDLYIFPKNTQFKITKKCDRRRLISEKELQTILKDYPPLKIYSCKELEDIVINNPIQDFLLTCIIDNSLEVHCEPSTYLLKKR